MKRINTEHANLIFFGNRADADMQLTDLAAFLQDVDLFIKKTHKQLSSEYGKALVPFDIEFTIERYENSFGEILRKSFVIALIIFLEREIGEYCNDYQKYLNIDIGWKDLRGSVLDRFQLFTKKFLKLKMNFKNKNMWQDLHGLFALRNCLVHADGDLSKFSEAQKLKDFAKRYRSINLQERYVELSLKACEDCLMLVKEFIEEIYDYALSFFPGEYGGQRTSDNITQTDKSQT